MTEISTDVAIKATANMDNSVSKPVKVGSISAVSSSSKNHTPIKIVDTSKKLSQSDSFVSEKRTGTLKEKISSQKSQKISLKEAGSLLLEGFARKTNEMIGAVIKHPIRSIGMIAGVTLAIGALPFIGIPTAVGSAALLAIFATMATGKAILNLAKFVSNNSSEKYDLARDNLRDLGGDSVDLALSLPFLPKSISTLSKFGKFGKIGFNRSLIADIKNTSGLKNKFYAYYSGNKELYRGMNFQALLAKNNLTAEQISQIRELSKLDNVTFAKKVFDILTKDMKEKPAFAIMPNSQNGEFAYFSPANAIIKCNKYSLERVSQDKIVGALVHELKHFEQQCTIYRYTQGKIPEQYSSQAFLQRMKDGTDYSFVKNKVYQDVVKNHPPILAGTKEAKYAKKLLSAKYNYVNASENFDKYICNFLEKDAVAATRQPKQISTIKDFYLAQNNQTKGFSEMLVASGFEQNKFVLREVSLKSNIKAIAVLEILNPKENEKQL